jgi:hypothetical protein
VDYRGRSQYPKSLPERGSFQDEYEKETDERTPREKVIDFIDQMYEDVPVRVERIASKAGITEK